MFFSLLLFPADCDCGRGPVYNLNNLSGPVHIGPEDDDDDKSEENSEEYKDRSALPSPSPAPTPPQMTPVEKEVQDDLVVSIHVGYLLGFNFAFWLIGILSVKFVKCLEHYCTCGVKDQAPPAPAAAAAEVDDTPLEIARAAFNSATNRVLLYSPPRNRTNSLCVLPR